MSDRTCGTCRWWSVGDLMEDTVAAGWRGCELTTTDYCLHDDGVAYPDTLARAESGEGGSGLLLTRAGFGCTQWAAADAAQSATLHIDRREFRDQIRACRAGHRGAPWRWCADRVVRQIAEQRGVSLDDVRAVVLEPPAMMPEEV